MFGSLVDVYDIQLNSLSHLDLAHQVIEFGKAFSAHPGHQGPLPETIPGGEELSRLGTDFLGITTAASSGDRNKKAERDQMRPKVVAHAQITLGWAAFRAYRENNFSLVNDLSIPVKKKSATRNTTQISLIAPPNPQVKHGATSTTVITTFGRVPGAYAYEVFACQGDPSQEGNWNKVGQSNHCKIEVSGLDPGKIYHFRVRALGNTSQGPWTAILNLMVI